MTDTSIEDTMTETTRKENTMSEDTVIIDETTVDSIDDAATTVEDIVDDVAVDEVVPAIDDSAEVLVPEPIEEPQPLSIEDIEAMLAMQFPPEEPKEPFPGDDTATWQYWSDMDTAERGVPDEWVWERLRIRRNTLISETDWRVVPDAPWDTAPWLAYRQALRDLPDSTKDPRKAVWPELPA